MGSKFGRGVSTPKFKVEHGAELESWNECMRIFEIAVIGAVLRDNSDTGVTTRTLGKARLRRNL